MCSTPWSSITARSHTSTHGVERVGDEHDRAAVALELAHAVDAALLERLVAHREHLVDQQDLGVDVHRHGEAEPHEHARGVELHLVVHEVRELGEGHDVVVDALGVAPAEARGTTRSGRRSRAR